MNRYYREGIRLIASSIGIIVLGLSINLLSWQFKLVSGGLPGYALTVNYLFGFPVGLALLIANTVMLAFSFVLAGKTAGIRGVYGYVLLSVLIDTSRSVMHLSQVQLPSFALQVLFIGLQGIVAPIGISLALANKYSFGSYSSMIPIVNRFAKISAPVFFFVMDGILTIITMVAFGFVPASLLFINALMFFLTFRISLPFAERHLSVK